MTNSTTPTVTPPAAATGGTAESHVIDVELSRPLVDIPRVDGNGVAADKALLLVRLFGQPLGLQRAAIPADGLSADAIGALVLETLGEEIAATAGVDRQYLVLDALGATPTAFHHAHDAYLQKASPCSVVLCTRNRSDELAACLESLVGQDHPDFAVWVIDNGPASGVTLPVVDRFRDRLDIHYVAEPVPGLSKARNTALKQELKGDIIAWIDDDETADSMWLSELTRAFDDRPDAVAASGVVMPAELVTKAQVWFEQFGGHSKGRGFRDEDFIDGRNGVEALYPLPAFGVGANMAFRLSAMQSVGGFDEALGAGTRTKGGEDSLMFTQLLRAGGVSLYRPAAITRHYHRRDFEGLQAQMSGYGAGLTAFYTALIFDKPTVLFKLVGLARRGLGDMNSPDSVRVATIEDDFPAEMLQGNRSSMLTGPFKYVAQRAANTAERLRKKR